MRIIQIIDSLEAGGAERMAVNYANGLVNAVEFSGLVVTRKEGALLSQIDEKVSYLYLNKKTAIDLKALFKLKKFVIQNKVTIVHAHGTSFFIGVLLKLIYPKVKLIWHEHYGARVNEFRTKNFTLLFSSLFFSSVFVVNHQLETWVKKKLFLSKVFYIPNFVTSENDASKTTFLRGDDGKRIVCLANLKKPKNHMSILNAFTETKLFDLGWSLHFIGKDYNDCYSHELRDFIKKNDLETAVFIYDSKNDIQHILAQATIGVLSSTNEGFPLVLLEYGLAKLAVISSNVGQCSEIIEDNVNGLLFNPLNNFQLQEQLIKLISDELLQNKMGQSLYEKITVRYLKENVMDMLLSKYSKL